MKPELYEKLYMMVTHPSYSNMYNYEINLKGKREDDIKKQLSEDKKRGESSTPLKVTTVKNLFTIYLEKEERNGKLRPIMQIKPDAMVNLKDVLVEITKWIAIESEKLARYRGSKTITTKNIGDAVKIYLGKRRK